MSGAQSNLSDRPVKGEDSSSSDAILSRNSLTESSPGPDIQRHDGRGVLPVDRCFWGRIEGMKTILFLAVVVLGPVLLFLGRRRDNDDQAAGVQLGQEDER